MKFSIQRRFAGTSFKPRKLHENALPPSCQVPAARRARRPGGSPVGFALGGICWVIRHGPCDAEVHPEVAHHTAGVLHRLWSDHTDRAEAVRHHKIYTGYHISAVNPGSSGRGQVRLLRSSEPENTRVESPPRQVDGRGRNALDNSRAEI